MTRKIFWTGGRYNEIEKTFSWVQVDQQAKYVQKSKFTYTNWADGYPGTSLNGDECAIFNCSAAPPCRWETKDCQNDDFSFICEAPLPAGYQIPVTTKSPKVFTTQSAKSDFGHSKNDGSGSSHFIITLLAVMILKDN